MKRHLQNEPSEHVLEYALLTINKNRINCVQKNIPYEESYLIKKKKYDNLLDLKFCHIRRKSNQNYSLDNTLSNIHCSNGHTARSHENNGGIETNCNQWKGRNQSSAYFILRQWCQQQPHHEERLCEEKDLKREDNFRVEVDKLNRENTPHGFSTPYGRNSLYRTFHNRASSHKGRGKNVPISYVVIGIHKHRNNTRCSYEEMTVEMVNYNVEEDGFYVQIHVDASEKYMFLLSNNEIVLIRNINKEKNNFIQGEFILHNKLLNIPIKRKIMKTEWFPKSPNVISLLTYEQTEVYKFYPCKFRSVIRLINIKEEPHLEIKIVIPDIDIFHRKIRNENIENIKEELHKMREINSSLYLSNTGEVQNMETDSNRILQMQGKNLNQHYNCSETWDQASSNHIVQNYHQGEHDKNSCEKMSKVYTNLELKKNSNTCHNRNEDLGVIYVRENTQSDHAKNEEKIYLSKKDKYKNLVVDYCFGSLSENILWVETCLFVLLKDGIILIYTPIITNECYISYSLFEEITRIQQLRIKKNKCTDGAYCDSKSINEEYSEDFLSHYEYFKNISVTQYREKFVCIKFNEEKNNTHGDSTRISSIDRNGDNPRGRTTQRRNMPSHHTYTTFSYAPYVINCMKGSTYRCINLLYTNQLVFICVSDKFGYVSFIMLNYYITPSMSMSTAVSSDNTTKEQPKESKFQKAINMLSHKKKKELFFFNIFNINENVIFEKMTLANLTNLINKDRYDEYYNRMNNSYQVSFLRRKMAQRNASQKDSPGVQSTHVRESVERENLEKGEAAERDENSLENVKNGQTSGKKRQVRIEDNYLEEVHRKTLNQIIKTERDDEIDSICHGLSKKKSLYVEVLAKKNNREEEEKRKEKAKNKTNPIHGKVCISDESDDKMEDFFSCYEDDKEIMEKEINEEINIQYNMLNVLLFDTYYTGMNNIRTIVLNSHNLLCFSFDKIILLHLVWIKFVNVIFYIIYLKNFLSAKLIHEMCKNGLYINTTIYKATISFYQFDYYTYLLFDHTKQLSYDSFVHLFSGDIGSNLTNKNSKCITDTQINFDHFQSSILYKVQYILNPIIIEDEDVMFQGKKSQDVYFIFTHFINLDSQRKEKLFMSNNINFFTCSVYKNLFLIYDCFKLHIIKKDIQNRDPDKRITTHLLVRGKNKNVKTFCPILRQSKLRNFYISTESVDDDSVDLKLYTNMLAFYINSRCNDYMNMLIKKNFIFYQGKLTLSNVMIINRNGYSKGKNPLNNDASTGMDGKMIKYMHNDDSPVDISTQMTYLNDNRNMGKYNKRSSSRMWSEQDNEICKGNTGNMTSSRDIKKGLINPAVNYIYHMKNEPDVHFKRNHNPNILQESKEIEFLKHAFTILHINDKNDESLLENRNTRLNEEIISTVWKKYNSRRTNSCSNSMIDQINPENLINDIKNHILRGDSNKNENVQCHLLVKKLIKIKNDYIHVKDYYLKKNNINLDMQPSDIKSKIYLLEKYIKLYYFFLDLNSYYENKFKKIKKRIIHSLAHNVIHFIKSHITIQNMSKALAEKNNILINDMNLCYQKQKLIQEKFTLLKKRVLLHNFLNSEQFRKKYTTLKV
ncbi:hypothetical protein, conserved [Plasmodium gonderi]|uniref:Uncharacterized protein n=1 Tax=Plasmodium gonderi TaxID=77519 RepID=A0A1Y1JN23_PLAGO|nr:hypothetical protein, conserved [Plasmodium gonderi]GAW82845.1 hypothetical protein, conserved [Plasmodium gonderi]